MENLYPTYDVDQSTASVHIRGIVLHVAMEISCMHAKTEGLV